MQGDYPRFKVTYTHEELVEHFLLVLRNAASLTPVVGR